MTTLTHLECSLCGKTHAAGQPHNLCACGGPLLVRYDLEKARQSWSRDWIPNGPSSMWRYAPVLPVDKPGAIVSLGEGMTPLIRTPRIGRSVGADNLWIKDEGLNPTGSFKARGLSAAVSMAVELGLTKLAIPSAGNAASALAAYAAAAGIEAHIFMPADVPQANFIECQAFGAKVTLVDGLISDCGRIVAERKDAEGWFDVSTLKEPYRIEGKKTMGFELAEQFGWTVPDVIVYPTGGGVGLIGIDKALRELHALGLIGPAMPRMVAVQSTGCAPVVKAFDAGADHAEPWPDAKTVAFGITVPKLLGDALVLRSLYDTGGTALAVDDETILARQRELSSAEGVFVCPEGGATLAAAIALRERGWIRAGERVLLINTGSGLKYPGVPYGEPPLLAKSDEL
jgi:threonine synthase